MGKKRFGFQIAFQNKLSSRTEVPLYNNPALNCFDILNKTIRKNQYQVFRGFQVEGVNPIVKDITEVSSSTGGGRVCFQALFPSASTNFVRSPVRKNSHLMNRIKEA